MFTGILIVTLWLITDIQGNDGVREEIQKVNKKDLIRKILCKQLFWPLEWVNV